MIKKTLKFGLAALAAATIFTSCLKSDKVEPCAEKQVTDDLTAMQTFATSKNINYTPDPSGIFYQIVDPGDGEAIVDNSTIYVEFVEKIFDGRISNATNSPLSLKVSSSILKSWAIALKKIKVGGKIKFISPAALAYGCQSQYVELRNQPLYTYIEVKKDGSSACTVNEVNADLPKMKTYADANMAGYIQDPSGILYKIIDAGPADGTQITSTSRFSANYTARYLSGEILDKSTAAFNVNLAGDIIEGWKTILPKIKTGGKIEFILPAKLAYGCTTSIDLRNQPLYFYVETIK